MKSNCFVHTCAISCKPRCTHSTIGKRMLSHLYSQHRRYHCLWHILILLPLLFQNKQSVKNCTLSWRMERGQILNNVHQERTVHPRGGGLCMYCRIPIFWHQGCGFGIFDPFKGILWVCSWEGTLEVHIDSVVHYYSIENTSKDSTTMKHCLIKECYKHKMNLISLLYK